MGDTDMLGSDIMDMGMVYMGSAMVITMESVTLRLNLRLMLRLIQPFFMAPMGMVWVTMAMLDILVMAMASMVLVMLTTMESVRLRQSLRLKLTQPYSTAPMAMVLATMGMLVWDIMAMLVLATMDMLDLVITDMLVLDILDTLPTTASVQHEYQQPLLLIQTSQSSH